ncbi:MAG: BadF/BadG/BcrA/BcrD ATPase family protein, partial [Myxococcota bacterium]
MKSTACNGQSLFIGLDAGSVAVSAVRVGAGGAIQASAYQVHKGDVAGTIRRLMAEVGGDAPAHVALTDSAAAQFEGGRSYDSLVSYIRAAREIHGAFPALLVVGGEKFSLSLFDGAGYYLGSRGSSPCAAGTGSFLDQQARRLGLADSAALSRTAMAAGGAVPRIASRCSVFAKTDLVHAQQQGYPLEAICNGLCHGLAANVVDTLFGGTTPPEGTIVFAGGVSLNEAVKSHIEGLIGRNLEVDQYSQLYGAYGAALLLKDEANPAPVEAARPLTPKKTDREYFYEPLSLRLSEYPELTSASRYEFSPVVVRTPCVVEVDIYDPPAKEEVVFAWIGLDIGSTSTKAVLLRGGAGGGAGSDGVIAGFYTRTAGQPLSAVQVIFEAVTDWIERSGANISFKGAGTTGSGRSFIGEIIGADQIVDEITAH